MWGADQRRTGGSKEEGKNQDRLDRALVAGLLLEVVLDQAAAPGTVPVRPNVVKQQLQTYLVQNLAGCVSLDRFRHLVQHLDGWFEFYFPLLVADGRGRSDQAGPAAYLVQEPRAGYALPGSRDEGAEAPEAIPSPAPLPQACLDELLDRWLEEGKTNIPQRSHRKLTPHKLKKFLCLSGGRWFRLRDFERYINMDRKTAWDYLQQFLEAGLLCHNRKHSAAVRYCLAPTFLKVEADALRLALSLRLSHHPEKLIEKISDFLIATGGAIFQQQQWEREFAGSCHHAVLDELSSLEITIQQNLPTGSPFYKLHPRWLQKMGRKITAKSPPEPLKTMGAQTKRAPLFSRGD